MLRLEICKDILCNSYNVLVVLLGLETLETIVKLPEKKLLRIISD